MVLPILLVDDNQDIIEVCVDSLNFLGYHNVITASNGEDAITKYKEYRPRLVIMDVNMPKMDGITAFRKIISVDKKANIVFLTANPNCQELVDLRKVFPINAVSKTNLISSLNMILEKNLK